MEVNDVGLLLRAIFTAAGGHHDDFDEYDRVMATERRRPRSTARQFAACMEAAARRYSHPARE